MGELYKQQVKEGRWFLHVHPASATSWSLKEITDVVDMEGVDVTAAGHCTSGLETWGMDGKSWEAAMKKTRFMSNSPEILSELTRKCDERHRHQQLLGSRAGLAARYPVGLCRAICMGVMKVLRNKECHVKKILERDVEEQLASIGDTSEEDSQPVETCLQLSDANVSRCKTEKQGDQRLNALTSPPTSHLQRSQLNQFVNPTHMQEPKHNEIPSNVHECNLQAHCTTAPRNLEHKITLTRGCHVRCQIGHATLDAMSPGLMTRARLSCCGMTIF